MLLFVGLGNPGKNYEKTPHNAGFRAIDKFRSALGHSSAYTVSDWEFDKYAEAMISIGKSGDEKRFVLAKPLTFMNKSGRSIGQLVKRYEIDPEKDMAVFYDDLDLKLGDLKIAKGKNPKEHKGLKSIFDAIKDHRFLSVRLGIDNRQGVDIPGEDYVLKKYSEEELALLDEAISESIRKLRLNITV